MLKKVKAIKRDFENLEADYKTQAHRQISIELKPRGDKGQTGILSSVNDRSFYLFCHLLSTLHWLNFLFLQVLKGKSATKVLRDLWAFRETQVHAALKVIRVILAHRAGREQREQQATLGLQVHLDPLVLLDP